MSFAISQSLLKLMSIDLVLPSNHPILCCPLFLLPSIFPSVRIFSIESSLHIRWPKYWSISVSPSDEYSELISFRTDWSDLAVQGTLKSLPQHHNLKASVLRCSGFLWSNSHIHTTGKTMVSTMQAFVGKMMFLLFNPLSRLIIAFLPRSKHPIQHLSYLQSCVRT